MKRARGLRRCRLLFSFTILLSLMVVQCATANDVDFPLPKSKSGATATAKAALPCAALSSTLLSCVTDGNYDRQNTDARIDLAQGVLGTLADRYDYLVVFTTFDFDKGGSTAFYSSVRNDVRGIGLPIFDNAAFYGSAGPLRGIVDMGNMKSLSFAPGAPAYRNNLNIFAHELMHTFGVFVKYTAAGGAQSSDLLGAENAHWNYFADSDASVMYGADWRALNGQFQSADILHRYSDLDLYLAGFYGPSEVQPITLIRGGVMPPTQLPVLGAITSGAPEIINISQIISANGMRSPNAMNAPKHFRAAFVLLRRPTDTVSAPLIASLERFRLAAQERFSAMTRGRGVLEINAQASAGSAANARCAGPLVPGSEVGSDVFEASKKWLTLPQTTALPCNDPGNLAPASYYRSIPAMVAKLLYLREFPDTQAQVNSLTATLSVKQPSTMDDAAWLLRALPEHSAALAIVKAAALSNGGFASTPWFQANAGDTALALSVLPSSEGALRASAISYLRQLAQANHGFALVDGGPSRVLGTAEVIRAFNIASIGANDPQIAAALALLSARKLTAGQYRGGYSDYPNIASYLPSLMETLIPLGLETSSASENYVRRAFQPVTLDNNVLAGNFLNDDYTTANAGRVLILNTKPNLVAAVKLLGSSVNSTISIVEGDRVQITAEVKNDSSFNIVSPFKIQWYDGDPNSGGSALGVPVIISSLAQNATKLETLTLDTIGRSGVQNIYVLLDTEQVIDERRESDNISFNSFNVTPAPLAADLSIESLIPTPTSLTSLPSTVEFRGVLQNRGRTAVTQAVVAVFARQFSGRVELARTTVNVAAQSRTPFVLSHLFNSGDELRMAIVADPQNLVTEAREDNNEFLLSLGLDASIDFEVLNADIEAPGELIAGDSANFRVTFYNRGVRSSPVIRAQLSVNTCKAPALGDAVQGLVIPAGASVQKQFTLVVPAAGEFTVCAEIDPENALAESNELNNQASRSLVSVAPTQPNLAFITDSLEFTPEPALERGAVTVVARAVNYGAATTVPVTVNLYAQDPATNPPVLGSATLSPMASGAQVSVAIIVAALDLRGNQSMHLKIDPSNLIAERSKADNLIIKELNVLSLPDLVTNISSIRLTPTQPVIGQNVSATVFMINAGGQGAQNFQVELREGAGDGLMVGPAQTVASLLPGAGRELTFSWVFGLNPGASKVSVSVDTLNSVIETNEGNNSATLNLSTQTGNQFATERYFSPNGDGIKDTTSAVFRFAEARSVDVIVRQSATTREVRRFTGTNLNGTLSAQITWDGKEQSGEIASDGDYLIEARDHASNVSLAFTLVTLDTNKSALLAAMGTRYANKRLRPREDISDALIPPINSRYRYSTVSVQQTNSGGQQIARFDTTSGTSDAVVSASWFQQNLGTGAIKIWLAPNGERVFFAHKSSTAVRRFFYAPLNSIDRVTEIVLPAPGLPDGLTKLEMMDEQTIYAAALNANYTVAVQTGVVTRLRDAPANTNFEFSRTDGIAFTNSISGFTFVPRNAALPIFTALANRFMVADVSLDKRFVLLALMPDDGNAAEIRLLDLVSQSNKLIKLGASSASFVGADTKIAIFSALKVEFFGLNGSALDAIAAPKQNRIYTDEPYDSREFDSKYNQVISGFDGLHRPCDVSPTLLALHKSIRAERFSGLYGDQLLLQGDCTNMAPGPLEFANKLGVVEELQFFPGSRRFIVGHAYSDWSVQNSSGLSRFLQLSPNLPPRTIYSRNLDLSVQLFSKDSAVIDSDSAIDSRLKRTLHAGGIANSVADDFPGQYLWADETRATFDTDLSGNGPGKYGVYPAKRMQSSVFSSYANLSVALFTQTVAEGIALKGIATDENFDFYKIDFALESTPNFWFDLIPARSEESFGATFNIVSLPEVRNYLFRLSVQDKAGNTAVSYSRARNEAPPTAIQGILMAPSHISPNGDSVQDEFKLDFHVTRPVSQPIYILNAAGVVLQTIPLTFSASQLGTQQRALTELGNFPDGDYAVKFGATVRTVVVDRVAPSPCLRVEIYPEIDEEACIRLKKSRLDFNPTASFGKTYEFGYRTSPDLFTSVTLEQKPSTSSDWRNLMELAPTLLNGRTNFIPIAITDIDGKQLRIRYQDIAGNVSVSEVLKHQPDILLTAVSSKEHPELFEFVNQSASQLKKIWQLDNENHIYLHFEESTFSRLTDFSIEIADTDGISPPRIIPISTSALSTSNLLVDLAHQLSVAAAVPISLEQKFIRPLQIELPDTSTLGLKLIVRISAKTVQGEVVFSNEVRILRLSIYGPYELYVDKPQNETSNYKAIREQLIRELPPPPFVTSNEEIQQNYVWIHANTEAILPAFLSALSKQNDIPDDSETVAGSTKLVFNNGRDFVYSVNRIRKSYDNCANPTQEPAGEYNGLAFTFDYKSRRYQSARTTGAENAIPALYMGKKPAFNCGQGTVKVDALESDCGSVIQKFDLKFSQVCARPELATKIEIFAVNLWTGESKDIYSENNPSKPCSIVQGVPWYQTQIDVSSWAEGLYQFAVRVGGEPGDSSLFQGRWASYKMIQHEQPQLRLDNPRGKFCRIGGVRPLLVSGRAVAPRFGADLEVRLDGEEWRVNLPKVKTLSTFATFPDSFLSADLVSRLQSEDDFLIKAKLRSPNGLLACAETAFEYDGNVRATLVAQPSPFPSGVPRLGLSRVGDAQYVGIESRFRVSESLSHQTRLVPVTINSLGTVTESGAGVQFAQGPLNQNGGVGFNFAVAFDGSPAGKPAIDGLYLVKSIFTDDCLNIKASGPLLEIDSTPPTITLRNPLNGTVIAASPMTQINALIADKNFKHWQLLDAAGALLLSGGQVTDGVLGSWNTAQLVGPQALTLKANDLLGNKRELSFTVTVTTLPPSSALLSYTATPNLISPNNDAVLDESQIRYSLKNSARVTLKILDSSGVLATLINDELKSAGSFSLQWRGLNAANAVVADAAYRAEISVFGSGPGAVLETETLVITIDTTPPVIEVLRPNSGFVDASGYAKARLSDLHFDFADAELIPPGANIVPQRLANIPEGEQFLFDLSALLDGEARLRLEARDRAGNRALLERAFTIDRTPPAVALVVPAEGALLATRLGAVQVKGVATDLHFASRELSLESTAVGALPLTLQTATTPINDAEFYSFNPSQPDGSYRMTLKATDVVGLSRSDTRTIEIDNTPPLVSIDAPLPAAIIGKQLEVRGSITDAHIERYAVSIANLLDAAANRWTELASDTVVRDHAVLASENLSLPDGEYKLRLSAVDKLGHKSQQVIAVTLDSQPPFAPINLSASSSDQTNVDLRWNAVSATDLAGYAVYRDGIRLNVALNVPVSYRDLSAPEAQLRYQVSAIDRGGNESLRSNIAELSLDRTPPDVAIVQPENNARVRGVFEIVGAAYTTQDDFSRYKLIAMPIVPTGPPSVLTDSPQPVQIGKLGLLDSTTFAAETRIRLNLSALDTNGNNAATSIEVVVDNQAPSAPLNLALTLACATGVQASWSALNVGDLLGYILYRDGELVNYAGSLPADLTPFAITATSFTDTNVGDGAHVYSLYAIDLAGNVSATGATASVTRSCGPPNLEIAEPVFNQEFEASIDVLGESNDRDIARVEFSARRVGDPSWITLGPTIVQAPFTARFTPALGSALGEYEIRGIATDTGGLVDPTPALVQVRYVDKLPPLLPLNLAARVDEGQVRLSWSASSSPDIAAYRLSSSYDGLVVPETPLALTLTQENRVDFNYAFRIQAVDASNNSSDFSVPAVNALVYTPTLNQPYTPVMNSALAFTGRSARAGSVQLRRDGVDIATSTTNATGDFNAPITLARGTHRYDAKVTQASGDKSKRAAIVMGFDAKPLAPTGLAVLATGNSVRASWSVNAEDNILGYRLFRNLSPVLLDRDVLNVAAFDRSDQPIPALTDSDPETVWQVNYDLQAAYMPGTYAELRLPTAVVVSGIKLQWHSLRTRALDYRIEARFVDDVFVPVATITENADLSNEVLFAQPYRTDRLRIVPLAPTYLEPMELSAASVIERPLFSGLEHIETLSDGRYDFQLSAVNAYAFESLRSPLVRLDLGDVIPPPAVVLNGVLTGSDIALNWNAANAPDTAFYDLYRDGIKLARINHPSLNYLDARLRNGSYSYVVKALDRFENASAASNEVRFIVNVTRLNKPENLQVIAVPLGRALDVSWQPGPGPLPSFYRLRRSLAQTGPFTLISSPSALSLRDLGLTNGTRYWYTVEALDLAGNESGQTEPVSGVPLDSAPPVSAALIAPTLPNRPVSVRAITASVAGFASAARAQIYRNGAPLPAITVNAELASTEIDGFDFGTVGINTAPIGTLVYVYTANSAMLWNTASNARLGVPHGLSSFSRDGVDLYLSQSPQPALSSIKRINTLTQVSTDFALGIHSIAFALPVATASTVPGSEKLLVAGVRSVAGIATDGLWLVEPAALTGAQMLGTQPSLELNAATARVSADGKTAAVLRNDGHLLLITFATGSVQDIASDVSDAPALHPDGSAIIFAQLNATNKRLMRYSTIDQSTSVWLAVANTNLSAPVFDTAGVQLLHRRTDATSVQVQTRLWPSGALNGSVEFAGPFAFLGNAQWLLSDSNRMRLVEPAGWFGLDQLVLNPGTNLFTAVVFDSAGNASQASPAISVTSLSPIVIKPDLATSAADIRFIPPTGLVGSDFGALVTVRNLGAAASSASSLSASLAKPDGSTQALAIRTIPPLAAGAQASLSLPLGVQALAGLLGLRVEIDAANTLDESNEANNTASAELPITTDGRPTISVVPDQLIFAPGIEAAAALRVLNPASGFAGKIKVRVEDASGALVLELPEVVVPNLNFGQVFNGRVRWPNTNAFAGSYRFNAQLIDAQGDFVSRDIAGFAIAATRNINLSLNTDRASYSRSAIARISAPLSFSSGNSPLESAQLNIVVRNAAGVEVGRAERALGTLLPGYQGQSVLNLALSGFVSGVYTASADLAASGFSTGAQRSFLVLDETPPAQLASGEISLSKNPLGITLPGNAEGVVSNIGSAVIAPMQARLSLIATPALTQIRQELGTLALNPGANLRMPMNLGALNLALGNYILTLEGLYPGESTWRALSRRSLTVTDLIPPEITVLTPDSAGTPMRLPANLNARVVDRHSAVASVEFQIDGGAFQPVARDVDGTYSAQLSALTDGTHSVVWRGVDSYGNQSQSPPQNFVIDTTPPVIVITGVSEGQISGVALNPAYVVTDNDLAISAATLNGAPFVSASAVTLDNAYTLFVYGQDRAGNRAERALHFIIERAPPELSFVQPLNSDVIDAANTPAILRTEPFASVSLSQAGFSATAVADAFGTVNIANVPLAFGANTLSARATDRAGNQSAIVSVTVTRPQIGLPLTGTLSASGNQIALGLPVGLNFAVTNATSTALTALPLRLRVYANSVSVAIASREFNRDIAANASINGVENFSASLFALGSYSASLEANVAGTWTLLADAGFGIIDPNPPSLSVQIPTVNQVLGPPARFRVSASDAESGLDRVQYRVDSAAWIDFGLGIAGQFESGDLAAISEGAHQFQARASDRAGNVSVGVPIAFTMDRTPPAIAFANVAAGGLYNVNVTPVISITDAHSYTSTQTLNGLAYVSATPVTSDGNYTLNITATDIVGNASSATLSFVIDKTPPLVSFTFPANGAVLGVDFTRVDGQTEALANVRMLLAGVPYLTVADANGNFSVPSVALLEGNNLVTARATDRAGNTGPDASLSIIYRLNAGVSLSGTLNPFAAAIALGQPVNAVYRLRNIGAPVIRNLPVRVEFKRAGSAAVIETQTFSVSELLGGAINDGTRAFQTIGQPPGGHLMVLSAQLPDASGSKPTWIVLDTQSLNLADVIAPVASILAPPSDSYQRGEFSTSVRATDLSSAITRVEAKLSNNAWVDLTAIAGQPNSYRGLIAHNVEEATQISARATDAAGNVSAIVTRAVLIDLNAPLILVPNIAEAALLNVAITPVITVQDFSPTQKVLTLNGAAYVEGTVISSDGDYVLRISATDAVARTSILERRFKLDRTAPTISITYPPKGLSTQLGQVRVSGLTEGLAAVTLRNATLTIALNADAQGGFSIAEMPLSIGENVITAQARDVAGNLSNTASVSVTRVGVNGQGLDGVMDALPLETTHGTALTARATLINIGTVDLSNTPMRWVARAVQGGTQLAEQAFALTLAAGRPQPAEASFASTTWPLGQVEISLETQLSAAGRAGITWRVLDRKQTRVVDRDPPVVSWITPLASAYVVPGALLSTQAIDLLSGIAQVEVKLDEGKWQLMSPIAAAPANRFGLNMPDASPGPHNLSARAIDVAGNISVIVTQPIRVREVLALSIDTPLENAQLNVASTNVTGATKPSATVTLTIAAASYSTAADKNGRYIFSNIRLANGSNTLRAIANDSEGNSSLPVLRTVQVTVVLPTTGIPVPLNPLSYWLMLGLILLLGMAATRKDAV